MYLMRLIKIFHAIYPELNPSFPSNGSARFLFEKEITLTLNFQELFSKIVRKNKITLHLKDTYRVMLPLSRQGSQYRTSWKRVDMNE